MPRLKLLVCLTVLLLLAILALTILLVEHSKSAESTKPYTQPYKLNITVYYETLCPFSVEFITTQFDDNFQEFDGYVNFDLIPYGKATQTKDGEGWYFECQHGARECQGNMIQACALKKLSGNVKASHVFISCFMEHKYVEDLSYKASECAKKNRIPYNEINECALSGEGQTLLAALGDRTHNFKLTAVPTIVFDNKYNKTESRNAQQDLKAVICRKLKYHPSICNRVGIFETDVS